VLVDSLHYIRRSDGQEELYHPGRDFLEVRNLRAAPEYAGALAQLRSILERAVGAKGGPGPTP
jgi:hypothetical protein